MIVGNGFLAQRFATRFSQAPGLTIFASGVSDSTETRSAEFDRERRLLLQTLTDTGRLVYFGSCAVACPLRNDSPYIRHKRDMEALVVGTPGGLVLRLPQLAGAHGQRNTLTNFLHERIVSGGHFEVWRHAERNIMDIDDVFTLAAAMIQQVPSGGRVLSIASRQSVAMPAVVAMFERTLGRRANCSLVEKGAPLPIDAPAAQAMADGLGINLGPGYTESVIRKYHGQ